MAGAEKWDSQNYNSYISYQSTCLSKTSLPSTVARNTVEYKLYVRPISPEFDERTLENIFSVCGKVTEVYISPQIHESGFRWAFIYYANQASADEALLKFNGHPEYGFMVKYANEKKNPKPVAAATSDLNYSYSKMPEAKANTQVNGVSYVTPPNCSSCKKLTFFSCSSCRNPFCNTECSLDGWRFHTSECIKVANLIHTDEANKTTVIPSNGGNSNLSDTVVSFMKNISISKKNFRPDEFAAVCKPASKLNESIVDNDLPPRSFPKSIASNNLHRDDVDSIRFKKPFPQNDSQSLPRNDPNNTALPKQSTRYDSNSETEEKAVQNRHHRGNGDSHVDFNKKKATDRKATNKSVSLSNPAKRRYESDTERIGQNSQDRARVQHDTLRENVPAQRERKPAPVKEKTVKQPPSAAEERPIEPSTDLQLQVNEAVDTVVTSVVNDKTFFVADPEKSTIFMAKFNEIAGELDKLANITVGALCFSIFEDGWYRAKILSVDPLRVLYIDFGNEETVDKNDLKYMPAKYSKVLPLACKVQLLNGTVKDYNIAEFEQAVIYPVKFDSESGVWTVDIL